MNRRRPGAALLAVLAAAAWSVAAPTGTSAVAAACSGVTVVVDFGSLGGARTGCFAGDPASGLAALSGAGFSYAFVPRQPGLVCQIQSAPDPCNGAPTHAYWSYWYAQPGGSWVYSSTGAAVRDPAPGGVEGWAFGAGAAPGLAPPAAAPPPAPPAPPPPPPPPPVPPAGQPPASSVPGGVTSPAVAGASSAGGPVVSASGSELATAAETAADGSSAAAASSTPAGSATPAVAEPAADRGVPLGFVAGLVLLVVLGAAAWWTARRHAQGPPESP